MIEVSIKLNPFGLDSGVQTLATIFIANMGLSPRSGHTYGYVISEPNPMTASPILEIGAIHNYDRDAPVTDLLGAIINDYENGLTSSYDNLEKAEEDGVDLYNILRSTGKLPNVVEGSENILDAVLDYNGTIDIPGVNVASEELLDAAHAMI